MLSQGDEERSKGSSPRLNREFQLPTFSRVRREILVHNSATLKCQPQVEKRFSGTVPPGLVLLAFDELQIKAPRNLGSGGATPVGVRVPPIAPFVFRGLALLAILFGLSGRFHRPLIVHLFRAAPTRARPPRLGAADSGRSAWWSRCRRGRKDAERCGCPRHGAATGGPIMAQVVEAPYPGHCPAASLKGSSRIRPGTPLGAAHEDEPASGRRFVIVRRSSCFSNSYSALRIRRRTVVKGSNPEITSQSPPNRGHHAIRARAMKWIPRTHACSPGSLSL